MISEADHLTRLRALWARNWPEGVPREAQYPLGEIALTEHLRERARRTPDKAAFVYYGAEIGFAALDAESDRFAAMLQAAGLVPGDRVAVFLPNCPQFATAFFGILKAGCVHVPVNPLFREVELEYELNDSGAVLLVALDRLMPLVRAVRARTPVRRVLATSLAEALPSAPTFPIPDSLAGPAEPCPDAESLAEALARAPARPAPVAIDLDAPAALNYTGGTTGMPKGCVHTQRDMIYTAATTVPIGLGATEADVGLNFFPVFWIAGEDMGLIFPVFAGMTMVLLGRWDPVGFMAAVERHKVTTTTLLVDNAVEVMEHPRAAEFDLSSLDKVRVASFVKKLNPEFRARWKALTGSVLIEAAWGMTETHTCDTFTTGLQEGDHDLISQPIFAGLPVPGTEFKICDFESGGILPLGAEGEICVRSPSNLKAYWNRPEATAQALRGGWLHTGDIGVLDEDGFLHFLGRRKEMLKVNGMSVFPAELEALLGRHPAVLGSGVIGREDAAKGQVPVAFVRLDPVRGAAETAETLAAWCRANMAVYKAPEVRIVDALPMTATGKVKKEDLARLL